MSNNWAPTTWLKTVKWRMTNLDIVDMVLTTEGNHSLSFRSVSNMVNIDDIVMNSWDMK